MWSSLRLETHRVGAPCLSRFFPSLHTTITPPRKFSPRHYGFYTCTRIQTLSFAMEYTIALPALLSFTPYYLRTTGAEELAPHPRQRRLRSHAPIHRTWGQTVSVTAAVWVWIHESVLSFLLFGEYINVRVGRKKVGVLLGGSH